jgi:hypothetical protein
MRIERGAPTDHDRAAMNEQMTEVVRVLLQACVAAIAPAPQPTPPRRRRRR